MNDLVKIKEKITFRKEPVQFFGHMWDHPFPLEMSLIKCCFMGCKYCFSTLNKIANEDLYGGTDDPSDKFLRLLDKANGSGYDPLNLIEYCLRNKYGIIFSNNVDPFLPASETKYKLGEKVLRAASQHDQPLYIQTKVVYPNDVVKQLLIDRKDIFHLYVTVVTIDDDIAKKYDTKVVLPSERLKRIKELTDAGVHVTAALNPYVSEWVGNYNDYFKALQDVGVKALWWNPLHLTKKQKAAAKGTFSPYSEMDLEEREVTAWFEDRPVLKDVAAKYGIKCHFVNDYDPQNCYSGVTLWPEEKLWPIDGNRFLQYLYDEWLEIKEPLYITWEMVDLFYGQNEIWEKAFNIGQIQSALAGSSVGHQEVRSALGKKNKMKNICRFLYNNPFGHGYFISKCFFLHQAAETDSETKTMAPVTDDDGNLVFVFDPYLYNCEGFLWDQADPDLPTPITLDMVGESDT